MQPFPLEEKEEFQLNIEISADSGYLVSSVLGFSHYISGNYQTAIESFREAIEQSEFASSNDYIDRGLIYSYLGNSYVSIRQYEDAIQSYIKSLEYDPNNFFLYLNIGRAYLLLGNHKKSLEIYNLAIDSFSEVSGEESAPYCGCKAYTGRGFAYLLMGYFKESTADFKKALNFDSTHASAEYGLLLSYLFAENYTEAHRFIDPLIDQSPDMSDFVNYKGIILQAEGKEREALNLFEQAVKVSKGKDTNALFNRGMLYLENGEAKNAVSDFQKLTVSDPSNPRNWSALGVAYLSTADWVQAIEAFKQSIFLDKNSYRDYVLLAGAYRYTGDHKNAIETLKDLILINSSSYSAHQSLSTLYTDVNQPEKAIVHLEKASEILGKISGLETNPKLVILGCELDLLHDERCQLNLTIGDEDFVSLSMYGDIHAFNLRKEQAEIRKSLSNGYLWLGNIEHFENNEHEKALSLYQKSLEAWNENALTLMNRGSIYLSTHNYHLALEDLNKAIEIGFDDDSNSSQIHIMRADVYNRLNKYDKAIADADIAINNRPQSGSLANALIARGVAYHQKKDYQTALKDFDAAVRLAPDLSLAHYWKGATLRQLQKYKDALMSFDLAINANARYDWGYYYRGLTYLDIDEQEKALADLMKAIEVTDDDQLRARIKKDLDEVQESGIRN